jgi:DNA-binding response OmpR family regulator
MTTSPDRVYVVDDDSSMRSSLGNLVRSVGWPVETFGSAREFLDSRWASQPSCLVLDLELPGLSGLELQRQLDARFSIIFLTGHGDIPTSVRAMRAGALEFLTKPPSAEQLLSAIRQALARTQSCREAPTEERLAPLLSFPPFQLDPNEERLWADGKELHIRRKPFAILRYLAEHPRRLVTREELVEGVWGKVAMCESLLRSQIRAVRQVVGSGIVETVVGRGYRFVADVRALEAKPEPRVTVAVAAGVDAPPCDLEGRVTELEALQAARVLLDLQLDRLARRSR